MSSETLTPPTREQQESIVGLSQVPLPPCLPWMDGSSFKMISSSSFPGRLSHPVLLQLSPGCVFPVLILRRLTQLAPRRPPALHHGGRLSSPQKEQDSAVRCQPASLRSGDAAVTSADPIPTGSRALNDAEAFPKVAAASDDTRSCSQQMAGAAAGSEIAGACSWLLWLCYANGRYFKRWRGASACIPYTSQAPGDYTGCRGWARSAA